MAQRIISNEQYEVMLIRGGVDGATVPVSPLGIPGVASQLTATNISANTALTATVTRISLRARNADIRYIVGTGVQTANGSTSHFIANGERLDIGVPLSANIGYIRDSAAGTNGILEVTELV